MFLGLEKNTRVTLFAIYIRDCIIRNTFIEVHDYNISIVKRLTRKMFRVSSFVDRRYRKVTLMTNR